MKKQILFPTAFLLFTILFAFSPKGDETVSLIRHGKDTEYLIHLKKVKDSLSLKLSDFAGDFEFVRLETNKECLLGDATYYVTRDYILAKQPRLGILQFHKDGRFIRTLVHEGKGPTEYSWSKWVVDESNQILYVNDGAKDSYLLSFDLKSGKYLGNLKKAFSGLSTDIKLTGDNNLMVLPGGQSRNTEENCYLYYQDLSGNLVRKVDSPLGLNIRLQSVTLFNGKYLFRYHVRDRDTIFTAQENQLIPFMVFDHDEANPANGHAGHKSMFLNFETTDWVSFHNSFLTRNNTSNSTSFDMIDYVLDKKAGKVYKQGPLYFDPTHQLMPSTKSQFVVFQENGMVQYDYQAIDLLKLAKIALADPKFAEPYRSKLKEVVTHLGEGDNPVLLIGRYQ